MNLPKLKVVFIFLIIAIINGSSATHEVSEINHYKNIVNWKRPMSQEEKKNVLEMIKYSVTTVENLCEKCKKWSSYTICYPLLWKTGNADKIAYQSIRRYIHFPDVYRHLQNLAKNTAFQGYYSNAFQVNTTYHWDDLEMKTTLNADKCYRMLFHDNKFKKRIDVLKAILMMSYLIEQENNEIGKRKILYRKHEIYTDWEQDYQESKIIQINRFLSTSKEKFLNTDKYEDFGSRRMYITINIPPGIPCGMDVEKFSSYPEEREVLIPPGTLFRITKVEKNRRLSTDIVEIEMTCLAVKKVF